MRCNKLLFEALSCYKLDQLVNWMHENDILDPLEPMQLDCKQNAKLESACGAITKMLDDLDATAKN